MFTPRVRFWLIVSLLVSNLCVGVLSLYFLRSINQRYAALFERSIPVVNSLRTLTRELTSVQRLARRIVDPDNEANWAALLPQMEADNARVQEHAQEVSTTELFRESAHAATIRDHTQDYAAKVRAFLELARAQRLAEASRYNTDILRPAHDAFQVALDGAADYVEEQGNNLRSQYTADTRFFGGLLLAFAGWPVLVAAIGIGVLALLVVTLLVTLFAPEFNWSKRRARADAAP